MSILDRLPVIGEIWEHTKTGHRYEVLGTIYNAITDCIDVKYAPCYDCEFAECSRQMIGHPKAWVSTNEDGEPRFKKVAATAVAWAIAAANERALSEAKP